MAMSWMRDNAAAFHGDPNRITIFGESAGAGSVSVHLVAPRSGGLFDAAIMESGPIASRWIAQPLAVAEHQFDSLVNNTRCDRGSSSETVACLRNLSAMELLNGSPSCNGPSDMDWAPTVDMVELTALPYELLAKGLAHDVPTLFGTNRDEGSAFVPDSVSLSANETEYMDALWSEFGAALGTEIFHQYPVSRYVGSFSLFFCYIISFILSHINVSLSVSVDYIGVAGTLNLKGLRRLGGRWQLCGAISP